MAATLEVVPYGRGIAVFGDTQPYKGAIAAMGGKFNRNLGGQPGWIFPARDEDRVREWAANPGVGVVSSRSPGGSGLRSPGGSGLRSPGGSGLRSPGGSGLRSPGGSGLRSQGGSVSPRVSGSRIPVAPRARVTIPKEPLVLYQWTDDLIAVLGPTKPYRLMLRSKGGRYDGNIGGHVGWLFPADAQEEVQELVDSINAGMADVLPAYPIPIVSLSIEEWMPDWVAVVGDTKPFRLVMRGLGGQYRDNINGHPGWAFPASYTLLLQSVIERINAGEEVIVPKEPLSLYQYGERLVLQGGTTPYNSALRMLGGRFDVDDVNGWVLPGNAYESVQGLMDAVNSIYFPDIAGQQ